jgi:hypothetical protein
MTQKKPINYVKFIESCGFRLGPDIAKQVDAAPLRKLQEFRESYLALIDVFRRETGLRTALEGPRGPLPTSGDEGAGIVFTCPEAKVAEYRPIFHGRLLHTGETMLGGDSAAAFNNLALESRLHRIKSQLLYAHSIVVSDSLLYINAFFDKHSADFLAEQGRQQLRNYLTLITALRPLIKRNVIIFYPQYEHGNLGFGSHDEFDNEEFEIWLKQQESHLSVEDYMRIEVGYSLVNEMLFFASRYDATLYFPKEIYGQPFEYLTRFAGKVARKDRKDDSLIQWALAQVELPGLASLPIKDIVSIRRNEETFEDWRSLLRDAIRKIEDPDATSPAALVSEVQAIIAEGQKTVEKTVKKSRLLSSAKKPVGAFTLSGLSYLAATGHFDPHVAAASAGLSFLWGYVTGSSKRKAKRSLKTHFATLTQR